MNIRSASPADLQRLHTLYPEAFPDEDLLPLVDALLDENPLSLVACEDGDIAGHILFTRGGIDASGPDAALLGPLAVTPDMQRQGVGSALINEGLTRLKSAGVAQVFVLGDPAYYGRFGFALEREVMPPYRMPEELWDAWQSLILDQDKPRPDGTLRLPGPWMHPELWSPP